MAEVVENEVMTTSETATEVLDNTCVPEKQESLGVTVLKTAGIMAAAGGGMALGFRVVDALCDWGSDKIRIAKAKKAAVKAEKEKIKAEKEAAKAEESKKDSPAAKEVLEKTE